MSSLNHSTSLSHISAPVRGRLGKVSAAFLLSSFVFAGTLGTGSVFRAAMAQDVAEYSAASTQNPEKAEPTNYAPPAAPAAEAPVAPIADNPAESILAADNAAPVAPVIPDELKKKKHTEDDDEAEPPKLKPSEAAKSQGNPYGLGALWSKGDMVARTVLIMMLIMSIGSWIIIVMKFIEQQRLFFTAREVGMDFWNSDSVKEAAESLTAASPFRYIADSALVSAEGHAGSLRDAIDLQSWISMSISRAVDAINSRLQGGLAFLGTVGSTSPFVGLFGTVWGIYHALTAIGISGQASLDKVAGPVGESLIMTAIGLATAVPAVLGYNLLVRRNKAAMERINDFAADILSVLIGGKPHDSALSGVSAYQAANRKTITKSSDIIVDDSNL
ncbi:biopolymer transport protein [Lasius niger]|uniref:Biopolymer transport protein ExbB n=1 Tax=Lasius niger TaxID=67767 RepID=A0A0J7KW79_LASNI|nr:biopolymer transport protein [Lasius niger]